MTRFLVDPRRSAAFLATLLLALAFTTPALAKSPPAETAKIEALIAAVEAAPDAVFIRNGSEHKAAEAADHLRLKWRHAGDRIRTARDFIRYCATKSSLTGRRYRIRFADGNEIDAALYFETELKRIEAPAASTQPAAALRQPQRKGTTQAALIQPLPRSGRGGNVPCGRCFDALIRVVPSSGFVSSDSWG